MAEFKFEIVESLGEISETSKGWKKELNMVSYNDRAPKYDIREWSPEHDKMSKGLTFTKEEMVALKNILNSIDL